METSGKSFEDGSLEITIKLDELECCILKDNLLGREGIIKWYELGPCIGKMQNCAKLAIKEHLKDPKLMMEISKENSTIEEYGQVLSNPMKTFKYVKKIRSS